MPLKLQSTKISKILTYEFWSLYIENVAFSCGMPLLILCISISFTSLTMRLSEIEPSIARAISSDCAYESVCGCPIGGIGNGKASGFKTNPLLYLQISSGLKCKLQIHVNRIFSTLVYRERLATNLAWRSNSCGNLYK